MKKGLLIKLLSSSNSVKLKLCFAFISIMLSHLLYAQDVNLFIQASGDYAWTSGNRSNYTYPSGDIAYYLNAAGTASSSPSSSGSNLCGVAGRRVQVTAFAIQANSTSVSKIVITGTSSGSQRSLSTLKVGDGALDGVALGVSDYEIKSSTISSSSCGNITIEGLNIAQGKTITFILDGNVNLSEVILYPSIPTIQATNVTFSNVASTSMTINWENGDGASRAVFVKEGTGAIENPVDGQSYTASADWAAKGTQLGSSGYYCVYNGTENSVDLSNLNPLAEYTVQVIEYNGGAGSELYLTDVATGNPASQTTEDAGYVIPAPATQASNITFGTVTHNSMVINWANGDGANRAVFVKEGTGAIENPADGQSYTASADWDAKGTQLGSSGYYCVYNGTGNSVELTNLSAGTNYTVQVFEYNGSAANTVYFTATATNNPASQVTTVQSFVDVFMGYDYVTQTYPLAWSNEVIFNEETNKEVTFSLSNSGSINTATVCNTSGISNYQLNGGNIYIEIRLGEDSESSTIGKIEFTGCRNNSSGTTAGVVYSDKLVFDESSVIGSDAPAFPGQNSEWAKVELTPPVGTKSIRIYRQIYYGNGSISTSSGSGRARIGEGNTIRIASVLARVIASTSSAIEAPTTQASNITFSDIESNSMTINWINGDGTNRAVFVKEGAGAIENPADETSYTAGADWATKGTQLGTSGYYCVYNGTGNSVSLTNLNPSSVYTVQVFEYNGGAGEEVYYTATATDNPATQSTGTLSVKLTSFSAKSGNNGVNLSWTTASEENTDKFIAERLQADGSVQEVATVKATGNSSTPQNYTATDKNVIAGETYYYRLKIVDGDGKVNYSDMESVFFGTTAKDRLSIYPNPVADKLTVKLGETTKGSTITIIDLTGQVAHKQAVADGKDEIVAEVSHLSPGVYIIQVNNSGLTSTGKFIKQ